MIFQNKLIESLKRNGEKTAIESGEQKVSYSALFDAANSVTRFLLNTWSGREVRVGVCLQDRVALIGTMIGVVNAGCVFVPIDGSLPDQRLSTIIGELGLKHIISSRKQLVNSTISGTPTLNTYMLEDILDKGSTSDAAPIQYPSFGEDDSIYVYFTSGSTGKPKGIIGRNNSLLQFLQWEIRTFDIKEGCRFSQFISPYFDAFLRDVFAPLLSGGTICIPPAGKDFLSSENIIPWVSDQEINVIHCVPSLFRLINAEGLSADLFTKLQYVLLSGEKIVPSELLNWYSVFDNRIQLVNFYGPTETTMIRTYYKIQPSDALQTRISIGYPIDDTELLITKDGSKPCDTLVPGELYIISKYATKGYLNDPGLTQERFTRINEGTPDEKVAFRTGDVARRMIDGKIDLIGRIDRQIKVRGIRIEPEEVENVLCGLAGIRSAIVMKDETNINGPLVAFVIRQPAADHDPEFKQTMQSHLEGNLPEYMIPSRIVEVEEYPLLSNGKINQQELLKQLANNELVRPVDDTEEKILAIWKEVLGDVPVSTEDSFYKLGGNSLSIMRLIGRIYKIFNVRIPLGEVFNNATVRKQAAFIKHSKRDQAMNIPRISVKPAYNASANQERIYFSCSLNEESTAFNLPMVWEIKGKLDKNRTEEVLQQLIERHESLRTSFKLENGKLQQLIADKVDFRVEEITCSAHLADQVVSGFVKPFDLGRAPLMRCGIIYAGEDREIFIVDIHHIICDGMSQVNLFSDFLRIYNGETMDPLLIQYKDYAEWEYNFRVTEEYISHREFWLKSFETGIPSLSWPTAQAELRMIGDEGGSIYFKIDKATIAPITERLKENDITIFSGLFSIYFIFLSQLTGDDDIIVGTNASGRIQQETEKVIGMFAKTLPVRYQVNVDIPFQAFAGGMHKYLTAAIGNQVYDLSDIVNALNKGQDTPLEKLFDTMFVWLDFENNEPEGTIPFSRYEFEHTSSKYPLSVFVSERSDAFEFRMEYAATCFTKADIELIAGQMRSLIMKISENPDARIIEYISGNIPSSQLIDDNITFNF